MSSEHYQESLNFVTTSPGALAYADVGAGQSAAVFIHGLPLCSFQWREVCQALAEDFRCLAFDQLGLGYSQPLANQDVSFAAQAAAIAQALEHLGVERFHLVGNDTGAGIAQVLASTRPGRILSLTLTNCEAHDLWPNELLESFYDGLASGEFGENVNAMIADPVLATSTIGPLVYEDPSRFDAETVDVCLRPLTSSPERSKCFQRLADWSTNRAQLMDAREGLASLAAPSQIIWGMADPVFEAEASIAWLEQHLKHHVRTVRLEGKKLFFPHEIPQEFAAYLREFWLGDNTR
jgi:pimeloyl-ACP methyl ester carboxylesterase